MKELIKKHHLDWLARRDAAGCGLELVPTRGEHSYNYRPVNAITALQLLMEKLADCDNPDDKIVSIDAGEIRIRS